MSKNLMGKSRNQTDPYATFEGFGPFGDTVVHVLKSYQKPHKELSNQYARWLVAVKTDHTFGSFEMTDHTFGSFEMGDSYLRDVVRGLRLTYASDEFKKNYWDTLQDLKRFTGFQG